MGSCERRIMHMARVTRLSSMKGVVTVGSGANPGPRLRFVTVT